MGYRYIGSKARIADDIIEYIGAPKEENGFFIDAFSGTGVVSEKAADYGWKVIANDMMKNAIVMTESHLLSVRDVIFSEFGGYEKAIEVINNLDPQRGFIWREYSPASLNQIGIERKYFTEINAMKIDAAISAVHVWHSEKKITDRECALLLSNIISATNNVANIAGTYGCFLSKWTGQAYGDFTVEPSVLRNVPVDYKTFTKDVFEITSDENDVVYLDPPYTKRQYASYYHIPETIVCGDEPIVEGVAGLRPWKDRASVFCYKTKALKALLRLILQQRAYRTILSYSNEGHVKLDDLVAGLKDYGNVELVELSTIGRYRPNRAAVDKQSEVKEYLVDFRRNI